MQSKLCNLQRKYVVVTWRKRRLHKILSLELQSLQVLLRQLGDNIAPQICQFANFHELFRQIFCVNRLQLAVLALEDGLGQLADQRQQLSRVVGRIVLGQKM